MQMESAPTLRSLAASYGRVRFKSRPRTRLTEPLERRVLLSAVVGRHLFYNNSTFDQLDPGASAADDAAVAPDKVALISGQISTFTNLSGYSRGINGVMVDIAGLPGQLTSGDFELRVGTTGDPDAWSLAPAPLEISRRPGAGDAQSDRVTIVWPDRAIANKWLGVTVKANANTGLAAADVFYFGHLTGDTGNAGAGAARVSALDWSRVRAALPRDAAITSPLDHNRDARVNAADLAITRYFMRGSLPVLSLRNPADELSFFVPAQTQGQTPLTLYPIESVRPGVATRVSFGVPFAKGFLDASRLDTVRLLTPGGAEVPARVTALTPWRDMATLTNLSSVRSALVQVDVVFADSDGDGDADPLAYTVEWGRTPSAVADLAPTDVRANWVQYNNAAAPDGTDYKTVDNVFEPPAYALFTPQWYGQSMLKTRLLPFGSDPNFAGYEAAYANFADTAVNDVDPRVTDANLIHYTTTDREPWLFDRATTFYQLAFRSGDVEYLRQGHRAAQFYANHIGTQGYFELAGDDIKYVTGEGISIDHWLTGDERSPAVHQRMIRMFDLGHNATYSPGRFWTERHSAAKLMGYVTGYELLGDPSLGQKARDTFTVYLNHQANPPAGAPTGTGMLMHQSQDHGEGAAEWIASPWMTVLLVDAIERYYVDSGDARVATFVTNMADGFNRINESMYYSTEFGDPKLMPYYLAGPGLTDDEHAMDPYGDMEHAVDVSKVFALAYFFTKQAGTPNPVYLQRFKELDETAQFAFDYWTRPGGPEAGLPVYRLTPARKFNWWFRTTADRDWLIGQ